MNAGSTSPRTSDTPGPGMPTPAKVAVGVLAGLAVLLLLSTVVTVAAWDAVVDALADGQPDSPRSDAVQVVRVNVAQSGAFGLLCAVSAVGLARGHGWARWSGLAGAGLLGLVTVVTTVLLGGVSASSLLLLVLCVAAVTSLLARPTAAWARSGPRSG